MKKPLLILVLLFVLIVACVCGTTASLPPSATPQPNATHTVIKMSLYEFIATWDRMTDIQRKDFEQESIGQWVDWTGQVDEVSGGNGFAGAYISLESPTGQNVGITLVGVPQETLKKLNKGQTIHFTGRLDTFEYHILNLAIMVEEVQIIP